MSYSTASDNLSLILNRFENHLNENDILLNTSSDVLNNQFSTLIRLGLAQENPAPPTAPGNMMSTGSVDNIAKEPTLLERFNQLLNRFNQQLQATRDHNNAHRFVSETLDNQFNTSVKGDTAMAAAPAGYRH